MLKKPIKYEDYNGNERTEDFFFNLTQAELTEMEVSIDGGLSTKLKKIVDTEDQKELVASFKELIMKAYGEKSPDGKRFIKSQEVKDSFMESEAYSVLFTELTTDATAAADFVNAIIPQKLIKAVE